MTTDLIINGKNYDQLFRLAKQKIHDQIFGIRGSEDMIAEGDEVTIVSDGSPYNTSVYFHGKKLKNITAIEFGRLDIDNPLMVRIELLMPKIHLRAKAEYVD